MVRKLITSMITLDIPWTTTTYWYVIQRNLAAYKIRIQGHAMMYSTFTCTNSRLNSFDDNIVSFSYQWYIPYCPWITLAYHCATTRNDACQSNNVITIDNGHQMGIISSAIILPAFRTSIHMHCKEHAHKSRLVLQRTQLLQCL